MPSTVAKCGTDSGYRRHLARREQACDECLIAHAEANRRPGKRRSWVRCGSDAGYYRHLRVLKEAACDDCKAAHAAVQRRWVAGQSPERRRCLCGATLRTDLTLCSRCRRSPRRRDRIETEQENSMPSPTRWVRSGPILRPVYDERTEAA